MNETTEQLCEAIGVGFMLRSILEQQDGETMIDAAMRLQCEVRKLRDCLAEVEGERDEWRQRYESAEFWRDWCYPEGATAKQVQDELNDYHMVMGEVAKVYCRLTNGLISKVTTRAECVISEVERIYEERINLERA